MSNLSLQKSIRTCKVDPGWSNRIQSDRFLNSENLLCPTWAVGGTPGNQVGYDLAGRKVCENSFVTKTAGSSKASDRIYVENDLRPDYVSYIALNAAGIQGAIYGNQSIQNESNAWAQDKQKIDSVTGHFNNDWSSSIENRSCSLTPYDSLMQSQRNRNIQAQFNGYSSNVYRTSAGI